MTLGKRVFDLACVALTAPLWVPAAAIVASIVHVRDGAPVIYASERMLAPNRPFTLYKFRTMTSDPRDAGVSGGDKAGRITRTGRRLRAWRLDELPQLWNVIRGDVSLVGPRPPLRRYVEARPDLYARVLMMRPGLTGLATLAYREHEEIILRSCRTAAETDAVYLRRCVPAKARLDLIYARHRNLCFDAVILWRTLAELGRR